MGTPASSLPVGALVSQLLVAVTIEVDNEFEVWLERAGHPEIGLSLVCWSNMLQYVDGDRLPVNDLMAATFTTPAQAAKNVGILERWNVVQVGPPGLTPADPAGAAIPGPKRKGYATARGITPDSVAYLTGIGRVAVQAWPAILRDVEDRWRTRFGRTLDDLRRVLAAVVDTCTLDLPDGVPSGWVYGDWRQFPHCSGSFDPREMPLPSLLSKALLVLTVDYEQQSRFPIELCATTLRILTTTGVPKRDVAVRSGLPAQVSDVQVNAACKAGLAEPRPDQDGRKAVAATVLGAQVQAEHEQLAFGVETAPAPLGPTAAALRTAAIAMYAVDGRDGSGAIATALRPPPGTTRAGELRSPLGIPPLWERAPGAKPYVGGAGVTGAKQMAEQTAAMREDPTEFLPHYPVWDQNRGLGP